MAASKRFMNWSAVGFTPAGGSLIPIGGVTSVAFDDGGSLARFSGDADRYNSMIVNDFNQPTAKVETADIGAVKAIGTGVVGVLTATHNDAKNGSGTGAITYTFNCICAGNNLSGKHR